VSGTEAKILKRVGSAFLISQDADVLTAAHVVSAMQKGDDPCPTPAITLAVGDWRPEAPTEHTQWFPFKTEDCKVDSTVDVAECRPSGNLPARIRNLHIATPVQLEWNIQPDGTELAFTGFPLESRDPVTFRAHVAAYSWPDQATPQLVLDHAAVPGFSGSPVFLANGKVVAILARDGKPEAEGTSIARPVSVFREILRESHKRNRTFRQPDAFAARVVIKTPGARVDFTGSTEKRRSPRLIPRSRRHVIWTYNAHPSGARAVQSARWRLFVQVDVSPLFGTRQ